MRRAIFFILLQSLFGSSLFAQGLNQGNLGFENGNTLGWTFSNGETVSINNELTFVNEKNGSERDRVMLVTRNDGNDPYISDVAIPMAYKNSRYSLRLGNSVVGGTFDRMKTKFKVEPGQNLFQYHFALILQDDETNHLPSEKPGFEINITNENGQKLNCGDFKVQLTGNQIDGFKTQDNFRYKEWTTGSIDLSGQEGKTVTLEVLIYGCVRRGHCGYIYFDSELTKNEVSIPVTCPDALGQLRLVAPAGFESYEWNTGDTSQEVLVQPLPNEVYEVRVRPFASLSNNCSFNIKKTISLRSIDTTLAVNLCEGEQFLIGDTPYSTSGNYTQIISKQGLCDSTVYLFLKVQNLGRNSQDIAICSGQNYKVGDSTFFKTGKYEVRIKRPGKCDSLVSLSLKVENFEVEIPDKIRSITLGEQVNLSGKVAAEVTYESSWSSEGDIICENCDQTTFTPVRTGLYYFKSKSNTGVCQKSDSMKITVLPCDLHIPNVFSPNTDGKNDEFRFFGGSCIQNMEKFTLLNRWGEEVYILENQKPAMFPNGWDGKSKGKFLPDGLYAYKAQVLMINGDKHLYKGTLTILK